MPISKYNDDGTVDIYNSKTGEVRTGVKPEILGSISPKLVAEYQGSIATRDAIKAQTGAITSGIVEPSATTPPEVLSELQKVGFQKPLSAEEQAKKELEDQNRKDALYTANKLSKMDFGKITGMKGLGAGKLGAMVGAPAQETKNTYSRLKSLLDLAKRGELKGTGAISDYEMRMLSGAASELGTNLSNKAFQRVLEEVKYALHPDVELTEYGDIIDRNTGRKLSREEANAIVSGEVLEEGLPVKPPSLEKKTLQQKLESSLNPEDTSKRKFIPEMLAGATTDFARDIAASIILKGKTGQDLEDSIEYSMDFAENLLEQAETETDPTIKAQKQKIAFDTLNKMGDRQKEIQDMFSKRIDKPYWKRAIGVGTEVGGDIAMAEGVYKLAKGGVKLAGKGLGKVSEALKPAGKETVKTISSTAEKGQSGLGKVKDILTPRGKLYGKEQAAANATKVSQETMKQVSDDIWNAGKDFASRDTAKMKAFKELEPGIKQLAKGEPKDILRLLSDYDVAFKKTGGTLTSEKAQMMGELYRVARQSLTKVVPEAAKYRTIIANQGKLAKIVQKLILPASVYFGAKGIGGAAQMGTTALTL